MTTSLLQRPGRWALPPQPPESWVGSTATFALVAGAALAVGLPCLVLLPSAGPATFLLGLAYAVAGLAALASSYLLVVQSSVTEDRRLGWAAGGFAMLFLASLVRVLVPAVPGRGGPEDHLQAAAALSLVWVLILPVVALTSWLADRTAWLLLLPGAVLVATGWALFSLQLIQPGGTGATQLHRGLAATGAVGSLVAALWWRKQAPQGNRGPFGWVGATLLLLPMAGAVRASTIGQNDPLSWAGLLIEDVILVVPAVGLYVLSARGYLKQARRWRVLESEVRALRASSPLLPGLSITPEDESGLPTRAEVVELVSRARVHAALQPVVDLATMRTVGYEALGRFGGRIPTDRWFRAAAMHGLGVELELLTLTAALSQLHHMPADEFLAVNTSPASLHDTRVVALLHHADLSRLVVEITEHDAVSDYAFAREALALLRASGARIAVDDVGAGFASLRHVLLLQPDVVKLDTSLTRDVQDSPRQQALVRALVTFSREVGAVVLAEGVEVPEQIDALLEAGVELGQGWHLGVPVIREAG